MRNTRIEATTTFVVEVCCNCGLPFAMTEEFKDRRLNDHQWFYCPAGHQQHYTGKTNEERLREQLERTQIQRDHARQEADRQKRAAAAARGQATKAKNRAAKGVCPHPNCKRSFVDVARHVRTQHPELVE